MEQGLHACSQLPPLLRRRHAALPQGLHVNTPLQNVAPARHAATAATTSLLLKLASASAAPSCRRALLLLFPVFLSLSLCPAVSGCMPTAKANLPKSLRPPQQALLGRWGEIGGVMPGRRGLRQDMPRLLT